MGSNFYQINNQILKLDPYNDKDLDYIKFNSYLMRKENIQRVEGGLDRGLLKLSYTTIIEDTGMKRWKVQSLMKWFEDNKIIECIKKSSKKSNESIYAYTSVFYENIDEKNHTDFHTNYHTNNHTDFHTNLFSNFNGLKVVDHTNNHTDNHTNYHTKNHTSKKEKEKENIKRSGRSITATPFSPSLAYTEKAFKGKTKVKCKYKGATINATRFDALSHHYRKQDNEYIEINGFVYEISKSEAEKADRYKQNNSCIRVHDAFSTKKEIEFEEIIEQIQYF